MTLLERHIGIAAFKGCILVAAALTALFSLLEFVEQLSFVGQGQYRLINALAYVVLTVPSRLLSVAPVSMLLGSLLALGALARHTELTALRSFGMSEARIIGSVLKLAVPIIVFLFLLAQFVIPPTQQFAEARRNSALFLSAVLPSRSNFWIAGEHQYLNVQRFVHGNVPTNIDIYAFNPDGSLKSFIHADRADIQPDGSWLLTGVVRKQVNDSQFHTEQLAELSWKSFIPAHQTQLLVLPPESLPPTALFRYVRDLEHRHVRAIRYEQELWAKIGIPFSIVAMIMITTPFVFGPPRTQSAGRQLMIGAIFGIAFSLSQQIANHLGLLLNLRPSVTALAPSVLLMALAAYLFHRAHPQGVPLRPPPPLP